jgi:serine-type D-Ala-D-Ala carboxypeptidase
VSRTVAALAVAATLAGCGGVRPDPVPVPLADCGPRACDWTTVTAAVDSAVADGAAPGAVLGVSVGGARLFHAAGRVALDQPDRPDAHTVYDLASLTKVVALTTLAMMAVDRGRLALDEPVRGVVPRFAGPGKEGVTLRHLLTHSSGLPAHRPLWREAARPDSALALALATPLDTAPGLRTVYSDLGAIALGVAVETALGDRLDRLADRLLFGPLRMRDTRFRPPGSWRRRVAPTELDPWRGRIVRGEVHDENAARLGGVSGHAGLFGSAADLLAFGEWLLDRWRGVPAARTTPRVRLETVREFTRHQQLVPGSSRALGWDTPSSGSSAGTRLGPRSFGHTGFTGTSIWIDPDRDLVVVLLTNRVHPTRDNPRLAPLRALVADRVVGTLEAGTR